MRRIIGLVFLITASSSYAGVIDNNSDLVSALELHQAACSGVDDINESPWDIKSLYNCETKNFFVPYQLWTGAKWNGDQDTNCMHEADSTFYVNRTSGTTIKGPVEWENPKTLNTLKVWKREKLNGSKQQYFACNDKGIGRVFDSRKGGRYYDLGRCKFPAGQGWEIGKQRKCKSTAIEIVKVEIDSNKSLSAIEFKWWYQSRSGEYVHDHTYRYEPNIGSVNAWKQ
jgi:hypothetical protein